MSASTESSPDRPAARRPAGPLAGAWRWLALAFAATALGFWPTTFGPFGPPDALRIVHGMCAAGWMAMLVAQAWLIEHRHRAAHRWIGRASLVVAPGLVLSALLVVINSLATGGVAHFPRGLLLVLTWIDLWSLLLFSGLYVAAIALRRRTWLHGRLMASTVFVALPPALGRLYGMNIPALHGLAGALHPSFLTGEIALAVLIVRDGMAGRWRTPWCVAFVALAAIEATMFAAPGFGPFVTLCEALGLPPQ